MYLIQRTRDGAYVAKPGSEHSYTRKLESARVYSTWEAAEHDRCRENERVISLPEMLSARS